MGFPLASSTGSPTASSLLDYTGIAWLGEVALYCGLDTLREEYNTAGRIVIGGCFFGAACTREPMEHEIRAISDEIVAIKDRVEKLCFPMCYNRHWFMVCLCFDAKEVRIADSLGYSPPENLIRNLRRLFSLVKLPIDDWSDKWIRTASPQQMDGHSCGVVVLALIESVCSEKGAVRWSAQKAIHERRRWLTRCIDQHCATIVASRKELSSQQSQGLSCRNDSVHAETLKGATPLISDQGSPVVGAQLYPESSLSMKEVDPPTYAEMQDFSLNLESSPSSQECLDPALVQTYLDLTHQRLSTLSKRQPLQTDIITIARRKDPLPYSTFPLDQDQRKCELCGPPFLPLGGKLQDTLACSFECGKRYVVEHMGKPHGFRVKHGKSKRLADGKGITREICLTQDTNWSVCIASSVVSFIHTKVPLSRRRSATRAAREWNVLGVSTSPMSRQLVVLEFLMLCWNITTT